MIASDHPPPYSPTRTVPGRHGIEFPTFGVDRSKMRVEVSPESKARAIQLAEKALVTVADLERSIEAEECGLKGDKAATREAWGALVTRKRLIGRLRSHIEEARDRHCEGRPITAKAAASEGETVARQLGYPTLLLELAQVVEAGDR